MLIDLDPRLQTLLTVLGLILVIAPIIGRRMLARNPASEWGARLVLLGPMLRAVGRTPLGQLLPPLVRATIDSLTESDPPPARPRVDPEATPVGPRKLPPPLPLLCLWLVGCGSLAEARETARDVRAVVAAAAPVVHERCTAYAVTERARHASLPPGPERERATLESRRELEARRCPQIWTAYDVARTSSIALDAVIASAAAGQCVGVSRAAKGCNVAGAVVDAVTASAQIAEAVR